MIGKEENGCPPLGCGGENENITDIRQVGFAFWGDVNGN